MLEAAIAIGTLLNLAITAGKGATEIAKDIDELTQSPDVDTSELKELVSRLLDRLIGMQAQQLAMRSALAEFEENQKRLDRFEQQASRYALVQTDFGAFVRELKPGDQAGEPVHCVCTACYDRQVISRLQPIAHNTLGCPTCKATFLKSDGRGSGIMVAPVSRSRYDGF